MADQNPPQRIGGGLQPVQAANLGGAFSLPAAPESPVLSPSFVGGPGGGTSSNSTSGGGGTGLTPTPLKIAAYNAAIGDLVRCDPTGGAFTVNLPAASAKAGPIAVKVQSASNNGVTVTPAGADTVDGVAGVFPTPPTTLGTREYVTLYSDGVSDWMVMG